MPNTVVIFGASGDLTSRKLIPALYLLHQKGRLPEDTKVVGVSRSQLSSEDWRKSLGETTRKFAGKEFDETSWKRFVDLVYYEPGDIDSHESFVRLHAKLKELEGGQKSSRLYYLSTKPELYATAIEQLGLAGMAQEDPSIDLADVLTPDGEQLVDLMSASCRPDAQAAESLAPKPLLQQSQAQNELWPAWISANTPGKDSAAAPVLIFHGDADESVPVEHSQALQDRLCASGVPTERRVIAGAGHVAGAVPTIAEGADWLAARIAGTQPNPTC